MTDHRIYDPAEWAARSIDLPGLGDELAPDDERWARVRERLGRNHDDGLTGIVKVAGNLHLETYSEIWQLCLIPLGSDEHPERWGLVLSAFVEADSTAAWLRLSVHYCDTSSVLLAMLPPELASYISDLLSELEADLRPLLGDLTG
ncbi:hypothetical protein JNJ66_05225 [Candidatus Saccharibacteria bacterium]|nr:hypothetical protein [Candidatus Saccharibacteria bacterium]